MHILWHNCFTTWYLAKKNWPTIHSDQAFESKEIRKKKESAFAI